MDLIPFLNYFGLTPASITPLVIIGGIGMTVVFRHTKPIRDCVDSIKINLTAITAFLSTTYTTSFPSSILKQISPYQIQTEGNKIIEESGLKSILENRDNTQRIFRLIDTQLPKTKLDVERYSFMAFNVALNNNAFNPIKIYLYNHPKDREYYPYLAGVYIRDKYLAKHIEITQ